MNDAGLVMGTESNKELLHDAGLLTADGETVGPDDLILSVKADSAETADAALARAIDLLTTRRSVTPATYRPRTVAAATRALGGANLALVSVPGRFAAGAARDALAAGLHTMIFSDNVPLDAEVELKQRASSQGLLVMGPDCGTALIGGVALGFGNRVRRGPIGIVAAAGTGIQEVSSLIHRFGGGISHAIGTGARDLSASVGGSTAVLGLAALAEDPGTAVIVLVSKPPAPGVAARVLSMAAGVGKPVVVHIIGAEVAAAGGLHIAGTLEEAARVAVGLISGTVPEEPGEMVPHYAVGFSGSQKYIRGLYFSLRRPADRAVAAGNSRLAAPSRGSRPAAMVGGKIQNAEDRIILEFVVRKRPLAASDDEPGERMPSSWRARPTWVDAGRP